MLHQITHELDQLLEWLLDEHIANDASSAEVSLLTLAEKRESIGMLIICYSLHMHTFSSYFQLFKFVRSVRHN